MADTTREERRRRCGRVRGIAGLALYVGAALAAWTLGAAEIPAGTTRLFTKAATVDEVLSGSGALEVNIPNAYAPVGEEKTGWSGVVALTADNRAWSGDMTILSGGVLVSNLTALGTGTPQELKARLADLGLACAGAHCGLGQCQAETIARTCAYNLAYGNDRLVMPWAQPPKDCPDEKGWWKRLGADLSAGAEVARRNGCTLAYHNHGHEFTRKIDGVRVWDLIMADASDDLKIQFDVGHLAHAGERAADWFGRYPRRVVSIHAKDVCVPQAPLRPAPGAKGIDWPEMFTLTQANAVGWYIVEAEANPSDTMKMKYGADFFRREAPFLG